MKKIEVHASTPYDVLIGSGLSGKIGECLLELGRSGKVMVVTDTHVAPLYAEGVADELVYRGFEPSIFTFDAGEESKNLKTYSDLLSFLAEEGFTRTDTVPVYVRDVICEEPYVFVPNAFSPNGDGKNDILYVRGEVIREVSFKVYDRWGEKVFETNDLTRGWDGTFRGQPCEPGVYDYHLQVTCLGMKRYFKKGNVTLLR